MQKKSLLLGLVLGLFLIVFMTAGINAENIIKKSNQNITSDKQISSDLSVAQYSDHNFDTSNLVAYMEINDAKYVGEDSAEINLILCDNFSMNLREDPNYPSPTAMWECDASSRTIGTLYLYVPHDPEWFFNHINYYNDGSISNYVNKSDYIIDSRNWIIFKDDKNKFFQLYGGTIIYELGSPIYEMGTGRELPYRGLLISFNGFFIGEDGEKLDISSAQFSFTTNETGTINLDDSSYYPQGELLLYITPNQNKQESRILKLEQNQTQGPQGPVGPRGPTGPTGASGSQGPRGPQGIPGTNSSVDLTSINSNLSSFNQKISSLESWKQTISATIQDIWDSIFGVQNAISVFENQSGNMTIPYSTFPNYFKYLSSTDRKNIICGSAQDNHLTSMNDLGFNCTITYKVNQYTKKETSTCKCSGK